MRTRLALLVWSVAALAGDWPQWRGAGRDGVATGLERKGAWPALERVWERIAGGGYSGPVVVGDRVWVHARRGKREVVACLRLKDGQLLWEQENEAPFVQDRSARAHGEGPFSTPALAGGRLFTYGMTGVLSVWEAATGQLLWRKESGREFQWAYSYFGTAQSPLIWNNLCLIHLGGHRRTDDSAAAGAMVALRVEDGKEVWRWPGQPPCGASPVIAMVGGEPHLVLKTSRDIFGLDARTGSTLWRVDWPVTEDNTIVTPFIVGENLITSDYDKGVVAWHIEKQGTEWSARPLWKHRGASMMMSSPVMVNGVLAGFSHFHKGEMFGLDPESGRLLWRDQSRSGEHASVVCWGRDLLVFLEDGRMLAGRASRNGFQVERTYTLSAAATWAHPAVTDTHVIVRAGDKIAAYAWSGFKTSVSAKE